jgi:hypothetical protein
MTIRTYWAQVIFRVNLVFASELRKLAQMVNVYKALSHGPVGLAKIKPANGANCTVALDAASPRFQIPFISVHGNTSTGDSISSPNTLARRIPVGRPSVSASNCRTYSSLMGCNPRLKWFWLFRNAGNQTRPLNGISGSNAHPIAPLAKFLNCACSDCPASSTMNQLPRKY